jgi:hypothetical protein
MNSPAGSLVRSQYLIERFQVVFESGGGWSCACAEFVAAGSCRHSREAAGMRAAQEQIAEHMVSGRSPITRPG